MPAVPAAVVFDFDGLLADTETPIYEAIRATLADLGHDLPVAVWASVIGLGGGDWFDPLCERLGAVLDRVEVEARQRARLIADPVRPDLVAEAVQLLDRLDAHGIPAAVASSSSLDWVGGHLDRLGVLDRFVTVATADRAGRGKPAPDVYLLACQELAAPPAGSVALEDAAPGIAAARAAGLRVVAVPSSFTRHTDLSAADGTVGALAEVTVELLSGLVGAVGEQGRGSADDGRASPAAGEAPGTVGP